MIFDWQFGLWNEGLTPSQAINVNRESMAEKTYARLLPANRPKERFVDVKNPDVCGFEDRGMPPQSPFSWAKNVFSFLPLDGMW